MHENADTPSSPSVSAARRRGPIIVVVAALVGAAVGLIVGRATAGDGANDAVDTTPIELPAELGGLRPQAAVSEDLEMDADALDKQRARLDTTQSRGAERVSQAYGGAASAVGLYTDDELATRATVIAVRAHAQGLYTTRDFPDPADLGLARNMAQVERRGDVECLVVYDVVPADSDDEPTALAATCQRTSADFTVQVELTGELDLGAAYALTDAAFTQLAPADT